MRPRLQFTFEKIETIRIARGSARVPAYCPLCRQEVEMTTPSAIAAGSDVPEREIFRLVEAGAIHFVETDRVLICLRCLSHFPPEVE